MATTIQNLHSLTAGNQPGDLMPGEIAYNLADGFVYLGNGTNAYTDSLGQQIGTPIQDGMGWQQAIFNAAPIPGAVALAGTYDAQSNEVTSVTAAGSAAGFTENAALPAAAAGNADYYVIVQVSGTLTPPAPTGDADPGDWLVSTGTSWALVQNSSVTVPASNVTINPTGDFTGPSMQDVLNQIQLLYVSMADGAMSQLQCNGDALVYGNTTLGDADTDTLTVNATSAFAANVAIAGTCQVSSALSSTSGIYSAGTLRADGNVDFRGNCAFGTDATDTVTVAGPATLGNNLTVAGVTQLNGASQVNGGLTTTGSVALTGTSGVTLSTPLSTTGNITISIGQTTDVVVNSADVRFTSGSSTSIVGNLSLNGAINQNDITYTRPLVGGFGAYVQGPLQEFLVVPGTIIHFAGTAAPAGYLPCDGRTLQNNSTYADLFNAIGYSWGGSGTSFKLPDLRGLFLRGAGTNATTKMSNNQFATAGLVGTTWADTVGSHTHELKVNTGDYTASFRNVRAHVALPTFQQQTGDRYGAGDINLQDPGKEGSPAVQLNNTNTQTQPVQGIVLYCIKY